MNLADSPSERLLERCKIIGDFHDKQSTSEVAVRECFCFVCVNDSVWVCSCQFPFFFFAID